MSEPIPKRRGNPAMVAGGPSLNPRGRPKVGESLAERVRAGVDPDEIVAFLATTMRDPDAKISERLAAAQALSDRGWGRAVATTITTTVAPPSLPPDWDALSPVERALYLDLMPALELGDGGDA